MKFTDTTIPADQLVASMSREEILEAILELDLKVADEDFTLNVLKRLIDSLELDMPREKIAEELGFTSGNNSSNTPFVGRLQKVAQNLYDKCRNKNVEHKSWDKFCSLECAYTDILGICEDLIKELDKYGANKEDVERLVLGDKL